MNSELSDLDYIAISRVVTECVWRVDHGEGNTVYELYTDDGEIWFEGQQFSVGKAAIREWGNNRLDPSTIRHLVLNQRFVSDGPDRAVGTTVEVVFHSEKHNGADTTLPLMVGEMDWRFVRTAAGWRISRCDFRRIFDRREVLEELF